MAAKLHRVLQNFVWRLESIAGLASTLAMPDAFAVYNPQKDTPKQADGWARRFFLDWDSGAANSAATDQDRREAEHNIAVVVVYPYIYDHHDLLGVIAQDLHLIDKALRAQGNRKGWDADNTTDDIGLYRRQKSEDGYTIDQKTTPGVWYLVIPYVCKVRETE